MSSKAISGYLKHTLPVFLAACLVVVMLTPVYLTTRQNARAVRTQEIELHIQNGLAAISQHVQTLSLILSDLRFHSVTRDIAIASNETLKSANYAALYHMRKLDNSSLFDLLAQTVVLQFGKNDVMIMNGNIYQDKKNAYGAYLSYAQLSYEDWQVRLFQEQAKYWPAQEVTISDQGTKDYLTRNIYYSVHLSTSIVFSILLPVDALAAQLLPTQLLDSVALRVTDLQGKTLLEIGDIKDAPYTAFEHASASADLRAVALVPEYVFYQSVQPITRMIIRMIMLALLGALLYSAIYAYFHFRPMLSLLDYLDTHHAQSQQGGNLFEQTRRALASLSAERTVLQESYARISELMYASAFQRAASGTALQRDEYEILCSRPLFQDGYRCIAIDCDARTLSARNAFFAAVKLRLEIAYPGCEVFIAECLIVAFPAAAVRGQAELAELLALARREASGHVFVGASLAHLDVDALAEATQEMESALLRAKLAFQSNACVFDPSTVSGEVLQIPFQRYANLVDSLTQGDGKRVEALFTAFRGQFADGRLERDRLDHFFRNLEDALAMAAERLQLSPLPIQPAAPVLPLARLDALEAQAQSLLAQADAHRHGQHDALSKEILRYLSEHYSDSNLGLPVIAEAFQLSEKYLSQFIRKHTGQTYSVHIETLRLEEARRLLIETDLAIDSIASRVGYEYKNTFYKAFKRRFGTSPHSMRQQGNEPVI